jgi:hypothetical protein
MSPPFPSRMAAHPEQVYGINLFMEIRARVSFLTSHFDDLQGLRFVPIWTLFLFTPSILKYQTTIRRGFFVWSLPIAIAVWWLWIRWCSQFYVNHYGSVKAKSYLPPAWVFVIPALYSIVCVAIFGPGWFHLNNSYLAVFCACWLTGQGLSPTNPPIRRFYYSAGLLIAFGVFVFAFAGMPTTWWPYSTAILGLVLLVVSLMDHWLLLHTFSELRQGVDA